MFVEKPKGNGLLGKRRPWCSSEDNIEMDVREIGYGDVNWIKLAQDRVQ
jgi:hypothetical protein